MLLFRTRIKVWPAIIWLHRAIIIRLVVLMNILLMGPVILLVTITLITKHHSNKMKNLARANRKIINNKFNYKTSAFHMVDPKQKWQVINQKKGSKNIQTRINWLIRGSNLSLRKSLHTHRDQAAMILKRILGILHPHQILRLLEERKVTKPTLLVLINSIIRPTLWIGTPQALKWTCHIPLRVKLEQIANLTIHILPRPISTVIQAMITTPQPNKVVIKWIVDLVDHPKIGIPNNKSSTYQ